MGKAERENKTPGEDPSTPGKVSNPAAHPMNDAGVYVADDPEVVLRGNSMSGFPLSR